MNLTETQTYQFLLQTTTLHPTERSPGLEGDFYAIGKAAVLSQYNPTLEDLKRHFISTFQQHHIEKHTQNLRSLLHKELQKSKFPLEDVVGDLINPKVLLPYQQQLLYSLKALGQGPEHLRDLQLSSARHSQDTCNLASWMNFLAQIFHELGVRVPGVPLSEEDGSGFLFAPSEELYRHLNQNHDFRCDKLPGGSGSEMVC